MTRFLYFSKDERRIVTVLLCLRLVEGADPSIQEVSRLLGRAALQYRAFAEAGREPRVFRRGGTTQAFRRSRTFPHLPSSIAGAASRYSRWAAGSEPQP